MCSPARLVGVWSSGDAWQFAPLGQLLSDAGAVTFVAQYTLFPQATVPCMVAEVLAAITWVQQNAAQFGGDAARVSVLGHSAGAHLAACALLARACAVSALPPLHALIGLAGVYDVARHYAYETQRGVNSISTMEAAMGGQSAFATHSPTLALRAAAPQLAARLPPVVLMGSEADLTVPWTQGEELMAPLLACGAVARHLVYARTTHTHFATGWEYGAHHVVESPLLGHAVRGPRGEAAMAHAQDVVAIVTSRLQIANIPPRLCGAKPQPPRAPATAAAGAAAGRRAVLR
jgi:acetyl esterase/lipase